MTKLVELRSKEKKKSPEGGIFYFMYTHQPVKKGKRRKKKSTDQSRASFTAVGQGTPDPPPLWPVWNDWTKDWTVSHSHQGTALPLHVQGALVKEHLYGEIHFAVHETSTVKVFYIFIYLFKT